MAGIKKGSSDLQNATENVVELILNNLIIMTTCLKICLFILPLYCELLCFVLFWRNSPPVGHGLLNHEDSRSHTTTHHSR